MSIHPARFDDTIQRRAVYDMSLQFTDDENTNINHRRLRHDQGTRLMYTLFIPIDSDAVAFYLKDNYSTFDEAVAKADNYPGAYLEQPIIGGTSIVYRVPLIAEDTACTSNELF